MMSINGFERTVKLLEPFLNTCHQFLSLSQRGIAIICRPEGSTGHIWTRADMQYNVSWVKRDDHGRRGWEVFKERNYFGPNPTCLPYFPQILPTPQIKGRFFSFSPIILIKKKKESSPHLLHITTPEVFHSPGQKRTIVVFHASPAVWVSHNMSSCFVFPSPLDFKIFKGKNFIVRMFVSLQHLLKALIIVKYSVPVCWINEKKWIMNKQVN